MVKNGTMNPETIIWADTERGINEEKRCFII